MNADIQKFDAVIVGSGTSAYFCINALIEAGRKVAVVDERPYGGTCALRGCQPKKYLVANAEAVAMAGHLVGRGIVAGPQTDWPALQALKNEFLDGRSEAEVASLQKAGAATFHGKAQMTAANEITVGAARLQADHIVLATGASPRRLTIPGAEAIKTSEDFLSLPQLPKRIVFVGGGYISFEFAHVAARAGAEVTILHRSAQPLGQFDPDLVRVLLEASAEAGIDVVVNESPAAVEIDGQTYRVRGQSGTIYEADLVVAAAGRIPNLSVLADGAGAVDSAAAGIVVNEFLQSVSNPQVYAVGDCAATGGMLAPVADEEGKTAAINILNGNQRRVDYRVVPTVVFTIPSLAAVGLSEAQATEQGLDFRVNRGTTTGWPSSKRIGEQHSGYKVLIDNESGLILGAHLLRHQAAEVINTLALAIKFKIPAQELADFMWGYPTMTSDVKYMLG